MKVSRRELFSGVTAALLSHGCAGRASNSSTASTRQQGINVECVGQKPAAIVVIHLYGGFDAILHTDPKDPREVARAVRSLHAIRPVKTTG